MKDESRWVVHNGKVVLADYVETFSSCKTTGNEFYILSYGGVKFPASNKTSFKTRKEASAYAKQFDGYNLKWSLMRMRRDLSFIEKQVWKFLRSMTVILGRYDRDAIVRIGDYVYCRGIDDSLYEGYLTEIGERSLVVKVGASYKFPRVVFVSSADRAASVRAISSTMIGISIRSASLEFPWLLRCSWQCLLNGLRVKR